MKTCLFFRGLFADSETEKAIAGAVVSWSAPARRLQPFHHAKRARRPAHSRTWRNSERPVPGGLLLLLAFLTVGVGVSRAEVRVNLAAVASPASSYVSGDTSLAALNDGYAPRSSRDARRGSYGNWNRVGTQWVQYNWDKPISTKEMAVYWWIDGRGIGAPKACRLLYWDGNSFVPVGHPSGLGVEGNRFNATTFDEVRTTRLRLEMDSDGTLSTGILEWRVYDSGKSPGFPPKVEAGIDRDVVMGGKTYLAAKVRTLKGDASTAGLAWSCVAGPKRLGVFPRQVKFADAHAANTTAKFPAPGNYVLKLTATDGKLSASSTLNVKVHPAPPAHRLDVVYTKPYKINSPLWNSRIKALIVHWIPHCIDKINDPNLPEGGINNFIDAAKALRGEPLAEGHGHRGYVFANAWVHQTVESMCIALMVDPQGDPDIIRAQKKMSATLEDWIPKILAAQEPDGYLQTAFEMRRVRRGRDGTFHYDNGPFKRWTRRGDHEGYTAGYFIESAINHYTLTGGKDKRLYNAAKKLADCWCDNLGPGKREWYCGHEEMEQALVRFGRFVNDMEGPGHGDRYIALAKFLLDCRKNGSEYDQSHLPVVQQYEAVGHAVRAVYCYSGMADVAAETGDLDYESAVMSLWDNIVNRKYYLTGGVGSGETSEGFGPDYSLRNNSYCESCSSCGEIFFQYKMNLAYHDAKYADLYEETLYNALLGSIDLAGKNFYYQNPLNGGGNRYPWHNCPCCVGNIPRTLLMIPTWAYVKGDDGLYVNLFIGSTINVEKVAGTDVEMVQKTDYPWSGKVSITVNPAQEKKFTLHIRVPNHDVSALYTNIPEVRGIHSLRVNGAKVNPVIRKGYAVITRVWKSGDTVDLDFPMKPQRVKASDKVAADRGLVALRYGPLVYNVEQADQQDIRKPLGTGPLTTEWRGNLLDGVMVIQGAWADGSPMVAIPNYARNNRNASSDRNGRRGRYGRPATSIVWMKDGRDASPPAESEP